MTVGGNYRILFMITFTTYTHTRRLNVLNIFCQYTFWQYKCTQSHLVPQNVSFYMGMLRIGCCIECYVQYYRVIQIYDNLHFSATFGVILGWLFCSKGDYKCFFWFLLLYVYVDEIVKRERIEILLVSVLDVCADFFKFSKHFCEKGWFWVNAQHGIT